MRKTPHVAFMTFTEYSDVNPTLAIVATLVRRGVRLTYATSDRFSSVVASLGAEFVRCPPYVNPIFSSGAVKQSTAHAAIEFNVGVLSAVTNFYRENPPDLIVHDYMSLAGRILAKELGIRTIQISPDFAFDRNKESLQAPEFYRSVLEVSDSCFNPFLASKGVVADSWFFHREDLNIYLYPREFQLGNAHRDDDRFFYAGRCSAERPHVPRWRPRECDERRLILVSTSTQYVRGPEYFKLCVDALKDNDWHVVLSIGENNSRRDFQPLPDHFEIIQGIPQIEVLPYADLLVTSGGIIATMEAMYHGVPLLMITHGYPEPEAYADNNVRLGLGKHIRKDQTCSEAVRRAVLEIFHDNGLLTRVRAMQDVIRRDAGSEEVANRITQYIESGI